VVTDSCRGQGMNYPAASCEVSPPHLRTALAPPVWRGECSYLLVEIARRMRAARDAMPPLGMSVKGLIEAGRER
jgi:hypothetical protein